LLKSLFRSRLLFTVLLLALQFVLMAVIAVLTVHNTWLSLFLRIFSLVVSLWMLTHREAPAYQIAWLLLIFLFPLMGGVFYLFFSRMGRKEIKRRFSICMQYVPQNGEAVEQLRTLSPSLAGLANYLYTVSGAPLCQNSHCQYFSDGEHLLACLLEEVKKAEKFLFLEYFIVSEGLLWSSLLPILEEKAKSGVDVRILYDDCGCLNTLPEDFSAQMAVKGIKAYRFNPLHPRFISFLNDRDHRKICIIDGNVAFTGGANLSDEYANVVERHGHWKDNGILLKGQAVQGMTRLFLQLWQLASGEKENIQSYLPTCFCEDEGFIQVFGSDPLHKDSTARDVYLLLCQQSRKSLYLTTPYLILDRDLEDSLCRTAKSGVDVRILVPHIPDKWYVHEITRSFYKNLLESGISIYEYTPGFIHSKMLISDDTAAVIGSINCDFRSFYLNFECAAVFYHSPVVRKAYNDFMETLGLSQAVTLEEVKKCPLWRRILRQILRLFSPLL